MKQLSESISYWKVLNIAKFQLLKLIYWKKFKKEIIIKVVGSETHVSYRNIYHPMTFLFPSGMCLLKPAQYIKPPHTWTS